MDELLFRSIKEWFMLILILVSFIFLQYLLLEFMELFFLDDPVILNTLSLVLYDRQLK